jgi:hypothetical protein
MRGFHNGAKLTLSASSACGAVVLSPENTEAENRSLAKPQALSTSHKALCYNPSEDGEEEWGRSGRKLKSLITTERRSASGANEPS